MTVLQVTMQILFATDRQAAQKGSGGFEGTQISMETHDLTYGQQSVTTKPDLPSSIEVSENWIQLQGSINFLQSIVAQGKSLSINKVCSRHCRSIWQCGVQHVSAAASIFVL